MPKPDMLTFLKLLILAQLQKIQFFTVFFFLTFRSNIQTLQIYLKSTNLILKTGG